jgi:hypothetical protein
VFPEERAVSFQPFRRSAGQFSPSNLEWLAKRHPLERAARMALHCVEKRKPCTRMR